MKHETERQRIIRELLHGTMKNSPMRSRSNS